MTHQRIRVQLCPNVIQVREKVGREPDLHFFHRRHQVQLRIKLNKFSRKFSNAMCHDVDRRGRNIPPRTFLQDVSLLKDFNPTHRPTGRDATLLASRGFCSREVEFDERDGYADVVAKITKYDQFKY